MSKPMIRKAKSPSRANRGPDTALAETRSELVARLPKARLLHNPITSARIAADDHGFGLYCGDEGYFLVQPSPTSGFVSVPVEPEQARHWAIVHGIEHEFDEYQRVLEAIYRAHGVSL